MAGKRFRFSLESVLKLRKYETECARQELAALQERVRRQVECVEEASNYLAEVLKSRSNGGHGQKSLSRFDAFRKEAYARLEDQRRRLLHLREMEEDARVHLIQNKGAEEAIQHLREQEEGTYWKEFYSAETGLLDEQAMSAFRRQRQASSP